VRQVSLSALAFALVVGGCAAHGEPLLRYSPMQQLPTGALDGDVILNGDCFYLDTGGQTYLLLWPSSYSRSADDPTVVLDGSDEQIVRAGMHAEFGGGEYGQEHRSFVEGLIGQRIPAECPARQFWLVTGRLS
jgi:hypothetical protein